VTRKKEKAIGYWTTTVMLEFVLLSAGVAELLHFSGNVQGIVNQLGYPLYFLTIQGVWKILGGIALLIPRFPLLKEWAYAGIFFAMSGAVFSHIASGDSVNEIFPSLLLLILTVVSWYFRPADRKIISVNQ